MEMTYDGKLVMPSGCALMSEEEMTYVEGGLTITRNVFRYVVGAAITAGVTALGGGISVAGLRTVLGSMALRKALVKSIVKGIGVLGIKVGNAMASKFMTGLAVCVGGDFVGTLFDKYVDGLDGKADGKWRV